MAESSEQGTREQIIQGVRYLTDTPAFVYRQDAERFAAGLLVRNPNLAAVDEEFPQAIEEIERLADQREAAGDIVAAEHDRDFAAGLRLARITAAGRLWLAQGSKVAK